jgi:hypothetical protein
VLLSFSSSSFSRNPKSKEIKSCVSISQQDPKEILRKRLKSLFELLAAPSAILEGIDTMAILN